MEWKCKYLGIHSFSEWSEWYKKWGAMRRVRRCKHCGVFEHEVSHPLYHTKYILENNDNS